jgi:hypothetical protein
LTSLDDSVPNLTISLSLERTIIGYFGVCWLVVRPFGAFQIPRRRCSVFQMRFRDSTTPEMQIPTSHSANRTESHSPGRPRTRSMSSRCSRRTRNWFCRWPDNMRIAPDCVDNGSGGRGVVAFRWPRHFCGRIQGKACWCGNLSGDLPKYDADRQQIAADQRIEQRRFSRLEFAEHRHVERSLVADQGRTDAHGRLHIRHPEPPNDVGNGVQQATHMIALHLDKLGFSARLWRARTPGNGKKKDPYAKEIPWR